MLAKEVKKDTYTGRFVIDGRISSLIGGALADPQKHHFANLGNLAFFFDINVLGNRHLANSVRILLINNGMGTVFRNYTPFASEVKEVADLFIAAGGHYGNKSTDLIKHYAEDLGFMYLSVNNKQEFSEMVKIFCRNRQMKIYIVWKSRR